MIGKGKRRKRRRKSECFGAVLLSRTYFSRYPVWTIMRGKGGFIFFLFYRLQKRFGVYRKRCTAAKPVYTNDRRAHNILYRSGEIKRNLTPRPHRTPEETAASVAPRDGCSRRLSTGCAKGPFVAHLSGRFLRLN